VCQLEKKHDLLDGNGPFDFKRRNALANALTDLLGEKSGADTLLVCECLYTIAPPELWQFQPRVFLDRVNLVCMAA